MNWVERCRRNHEMCRRWDEGQSLSTIALAFDITTDSVELIITVGRREGIVKRGSPRRAYPIVPARNPEREKEILRLYWDEGWAYREIGDHFGVTRQRIHQVIRRAQIRDARMKEQEQ